MYRSQYFEGGRTLTAAMSAIDIALYDALGKKVRPHFATAAPNRRVLMRLMRLMGLAH